MFGFWTRQVWFGFQTVPILDMFDNRTNFCLAVQTERLKSEQNQFQTSFVRLLDVWDEPNDFKPNKIVSVCQTERSVLGRSLYIYIYLYSKMPNVSEIPFFH